MRRFVNIIIVMTMAVLLGGACQRRPFAENNSQVLLVLNINTDIVNHVQAELPENMRVDLYNPETAELVYTDYVGPTGGIIHPLPGVYDLIVYSIGSESTQIRNEENYDTIEAYTNEVSSYLKSQLAQFLTKRSKAAMERAAKLMGSENSGGVQTKDPVQYTEEPVVNQPDHIFVGWYHNLDIPVTFEDEPVKEITVEIEAHTLVETWMVEIRNVEGTEYISETAALVSGQRGSVHIGPNVASERIVSVFFDMKVEAREDGGKCLKGKFNTFGRHPDREDDVNIDLNVKDRSGGDQVFHFDVTDKFENNELRYILIEDTMKVEEAKGGGGGFKPVVDEWDDIHTDIDL